MYIEHEVLVEKPDFVDAVKEKDIHEDKDHNVLDDNKENNDGEIIILESAPIPVPEMHTDYDPETHTLTQEVKDPQGRFY